MTVLYFPDTKLRSPQCELCGNERPDVRTIRSDDHDLRCCPECVRRLLRYTMRNLTEIHRLRAENGALRNL